MVERIPARTVLLIGAFTTFGPLCIDTYLPALPAIGVELHAGASETEASLTACLLGIAAGQLLIGPISDRLGRRRPLFVGLIAFILASAGCALAPSIGALIAFRFVQGLGGAAGLVIARAMVRDLYSGAMAARFFALLMTVTGLGPIIAPQLGALLLHVGSWRVMFYAFCIAGLILLVVGARSLTETLPPEARREGGVTAVFHSLRSVCANRSFLINAFASAMGFGGLFAYISGSSFVFENVYGLSPQLFSLVFGVNAIGLVVTAQVGARLVTRFGPLALLTAGLVALAGSGVALLVFVATGWLGLPAVIVCTFVAVSSNGLINPSGQALALRDFGHAAGSAAAVLGVLQFSTSAIVAPLVGVGGPDNALPMGIVMAALGVLAVVIRFGLGAPQPQDRVAVEVARDLAEPT